MIDGQSMRKAAGTLTGFVVLIAGCHCLSNAFPQTASASKQSSRTSARTKKAGTLFVSDDKRFSIWMPRTPKKEKIDIPSPFGPVVYFLYEATDQKAGYYIGYTDYPADKFAHISPDKILGMAADAVHKKYGKGVIKDDKISYHGYRGREIVCNADAPAKVQVNQRFFLVKNRMYTIAVEHLQSTEMMGEASQYMDGLKILK